MSISDLQLKLHQIIDQVNDPEILKAVHTLLNSQLEPVIKTADGFSN
jgi:mannitol-1-phosphate/altronate dehydrogenase